MKEDDDSVLVHLCDDRFISTYLVPLELEGKCRQFLCTSIDKFRDFVFRIWFQSVYSSFVKYLQNQWTTGTKLYIDINVLLTTADPSREEFYKDVEAGIYYLKIYH